MALWLDSKKSEYDLFIEKLQEFIESQYKANENSFALASYTPTEGEGKMLRDNFTVAIRHGFCRCELPTHFLCPHGRVNFTYATEP